MTENKRFIMSNRRLSDVGNDIAIADGGVPCTQRQVCKLLNELEEENEQLKQQLAHHTRMHEWFRNEAYLLQNKLDNREDEIRRLKGDV